MTIAEKAKEFFNKEIDKSRFADHFKDHIRELEKWEMIMEKKYPEADKEIVLLGIYLHDIGFSIGEDDDHAVTGEIIAKEWLEKEKYDTNKTKEVLHCIRAHRCKDVMPEILEAKIIAFIDSASHLTQGIYFGIARKEKEGAKYEALPKLERDYRDLSLFPEMKEDMRELYDAWKKLIEVYQKMDI